MEKFHIELKEPKPFTLVFPHIPKTGGTTLLYHFRKNFGDNNLLSYGPHNRNVRFFEDQPQLEELDPVKAAQLRVVQGHGVSESVFSLLPDQDIRLLVVLRHPVGLTRSRFNHKKNMLAARGLEVTSESFMAENRDNFMSHLILSKFRSFISKGVKERPDRVRSILSKFDYVYTTEQMEQQLKGLLDTYGIGHELERRRVAEKKTPLEMSDDELAERNALDLEIFNACNKLVQGERHNPFGFDAEGRKAAEEKVRANAPAPAEILTNAYEELAAALTNDLRAEAALEKLSRGPGAITDPDQFRAILQARWERLSPKMSDAQRDISARRLEEWRAAHPG